MHHYKDVRAMFTASATGEESESVNARQLQECSTLQIELEGWCRMTPRLAYERTQDPRELDRWRNSALTILSRWDALVESLRDDPEATRWLDYLRFDRAKIKAGVRAILEIVLAKAAGETRTAIEKALSEAATFSRMVIDHAQRMEYLRSAAEKAAGPFPGHTTKLSPEVRKAVESLINRPRGEHESKPV